APSLAHPAGGTRRMKRQVAAVALVFLLGACNFFGTDMPTPFAGWFHTDRAGRASNVQFFAGGITQIRDYRCSGTLNAATSWTLASDGGLVVNQWGGQPRFVPDPAVDGGLLATPGLYLATTESWLPGATCLVCADADAGVVVACDAPGVQDAGP